MAIRRGAVEKITLLSMSQRYFNAEFFGVKGVHAWSIGVPESWSKSRNMSKLTLKSSCWMYFLQR